ncbi:hypothetical protein PR048_032313 [Dryococelus australis]|uniref:Uncharacterized protein n=1 Tax=Dryococelus australis TaxID=614101 RepID=A0ABQ9G1W4_9NEOP|nr:hypothetical protein PR048_032313 [Dryococelus australis]
MFSVSERMSVALTPPMTDLAGCAQPISVSQHGTGLGKVSAEVLRTHAERKATRFHLRDYAVENIRLCGLRLSKVLRRNAIHIREGIWAARHPPARTRFNPGPVHCEFSQVGIVPDDAAGQRVFSGISRFPSPFIPALLHTHLTLPSPALKNSLFRAVQIFSLSRPFFSPLTFNHFSFVFIVKFGRYSITVGCSEVYDNGKRSHHDLVNALRVDTAYESTCASKVVTAGWSFASPLHFEVVLPPPTNPPPCIVIGCWLTLLHLPSHERCVVIGRCLLVGTRITMPAQGTFGDFVPPVF